MPGTPPLRIADLVHRLPPGGQLAFQVPAKFDHPSHVIADEVGVEMDHTADVLAWVSGSLLTRFETRLRADEFDSFLAQYRDRLLAALGDPDGRSPYFYAFPRILCWGRLR